VSEGRAAVLKNLNGTARKAALREGWSAFHVKDHRIFGQLGFDAIDDVHSVSLFVKFE
jgi:hypothetical protein